MVLRVRHLTEFRYPTPVSDSYNELRITPLTDASQTCLTHEISVAPATGVFSYEERGGVVQHFSIRRPHDSLTVEATSLVSTLNENPFWRLNLLTVAEQDWAFYERSDVKSDYAEWRTPTRYAEFLPEVEAIVARCSRSSALAFLQDLNRRIHSLLSYRQGVTDVHSTLIEVLSDRAGVCQDFAHLMLAAARLAGIPARYVSGYLYVAQGEKHMRGELASHAWLECLLPDGEWHAFDPTNNVLANDHYVKVHFGRDYGDVTPVKGIYTGTPAEEMNVSVSVEETEPVAS